MNEKERTVEEIIGELGLAEGAFPGSEHPGIQVEDLMAAVRKSAGRDANCYPGIGIGECYPEAYFFSFVNQAYVKSGTYHSLKWALAKMVAHMKLCPNTKSAILVTDMWHPTTYARFAPELKTFAAHGCKIQMYFFDGRTTHPIRYP